MSVPVVYLANNVLRTIDENGQSRTIESRFGNDLLAKAVKEQQRNAWKNQGNEGKFLTGPALWGKGDAERPIQIQLTSVCRGQIPDEFLYTLRTQHVCAILSVLQKGAEEQRIWNNNIKKLSHLSVHPQLGHIACSVEHNLGTSNIGVRLSDDGGVNEVTEGDSIDTAPSWIPGEKMQLLFQSAGIGRNKEGIVGGVGPFSVQRLEIESGELTVLAEDGKFDFLTPKQAADGTLYYIKRPYEGNVQAGLLDIVKDTVLFPFRMAGAFFGYLNFFSMMYSGKQLKTVKQRGAQQMDLPQMMIYGNLIKAQRPDDELNATSLVPRSWQLIATKPGGSEEVVASGVLCFDLAEDGSMVYSNGSTITLLSPEGKKTDLAKDSMIQQVIFLKDTSAREQAVAGK
jgi:hypothetical protein